MSQLPLSHHSLKTKQRRLRPDFSEGLSLRVHRALSWLQRAEQETDDLDAKLVFLWIAFNAAYAQDIDEQYRSSAYETFTEFLIKLCNLDLDGRVERMVWEQLPRSIRFLMDNEYMAADFWNFQRGKISQAEWKQRFSSAKFATRQALSGRDTATVLSLAMNRVYVLRNQLMHGGATWNSSINREQVKLGVTFLSAFVPLLIDIMMDNPKTLWGDAYYPVIKD